MKHARAVLDLQGCQSEVSRGRGIGRYSRGLAEALLRTPGCFSVSVALNGAFSDVARDLAKALAPWTSDDRVVRYEAPDPVTFWDPSGVDPGRVAGEWIARDAWCAEKPDLVHVSSLFEGLEGRAIVPSLLGIPAGTVLSATAYDVIPMIHPDVYLTDVVTRRWYQSRIDRMRRCHLLLAISEASRRDIVTHAGIPADRVVSISGAADARFQPADVSEVRRVQMLAPLGLAKPYVMYTGGIEPRKNVEGLIRAFALLPPAMRARHQLAIVCSVNDADRTRLRTLAREAGLAGDAFVLTGYVDDETLVDLYRCARLFVFPSRYEGFGLPVLEAMACGTPTIAADSSSLPEIVAWSDALFPVGNDRFMAEAMARALADDAFLAHLGRHGLEQSARFSWRRTASLAHDAWRDAIERHAQAVVVPVSRPLRRLALVTPLHPDRSGIADFVTQWLPYLSRHFEIDLFCGPDADADRYRALGHAVRPWQALPTCWLDYDAGVLYQMGNSEFHVHMLALLCVCPGTVLLHDAFLSGLIDYADRGPPQLAGLFDDMLSYAHPDAALARIERDRAIEQLPMSRWVADQALGVIVTSNHALELLRQHDQIDRARCVVVSHHREARAVTDNERAAARRALGVADDTLLVCSFGRASPRKLSMELVDAWAAASLGAHSQLVFVGAADDGYGRQLQERTRAAAGVSIAGHVDDEVFHAYARACDIVVQLRTGSRGEASGAALYAMAYGKPVIATRHGSLAEIAPDACVHLDLPLATDVLSGALATIAADPGRRRALGERAAEWIRTHADPADTAALLARHVVRFNDRAYAVPDESTRTASEQLASLGAPTGWLEDVRQRSARSRSPRVLGARARDVRDTLTTLLPVQRGGVASDRRNEENAAYRPLVVAANDPRMRTQCGVKQGSVIRATGEPGMLVHGPRLPIAAGRYRVRIYGTADASASSTRARLEVVCQAGERVLAMHPLCDGGAAQARGFLGRLDFVVEDPVADLEIRVQLMESCDVTFESIDLVSLDS
ncbi:MAG TPA: glycosyltransferase [Casimicrobiaceae bacterium]|nr:glycosyltransferase [Casimicrobiaceae bacterium]